MLTQSLIKDLFNIPMLTPVSFSSKRASIVRETVDGDLKLFVPVPGLSKQQVTVSAEVTVDHTPYINITGKAVETDNSLIAPAFDINYTISHAWDIDKIEAGVDNGLLLITIKPKVSKSNKNRKTIEVK